VSNPNVYARLYSSGYFDDVSIERHEDAQKVMAELLDVVDMLAPGREKAIAMTKLCEAMMWIEAACSADGEARDRKRRMEEVGIE